MPNQPLKSKSKCDNEVSKVDRLVNCFIDMLLVVVFSSLLIVLLEAKEYKTLIVYAVFLSYYLVMEVVWGQTVGKMLTKTCVVNRTGDRPNVGLLIVRTLIRIIPVDWMSYMFGKEQGMHDKLSKTRLVRQ